MEGHLLRLRPRPPESGAPLAPGQPVSSTTQEKDLPTDWQRARLRSPGGTAQRLPSIAFWIEKSHCSGKETGLLYKATRTREQVLAASARRINQKASRRIVLALCRKTCLGCLTVAGVSLRQPRSAPFPRQGFGSKQPEAVRLFDSVILVSTGDISYAAPLPEPTQVLSWWKLSCPAPSLHTPPMTSFHF